MKNGKQPMNNDILQLKDTDPYFIRESTPYIIQLPDATKLPEDLEIIIHNPLGLTRKIEINKGVFLEFSEYEDSFIVIYSINKIGMWAQGFLFTKGDN